jgi:hypothetical protein
MLKRLVRATAFYPGVSQLYRLYYFAAARALVAFLRTIPEVSVVFAHRGFGGGDWVAGFSDIDLVVTLDPVEPSREPALLKKLWRGIRLLRTAFPFIGTIHFVSDAELALWQRDGGIRRLEFYTLKRIHAR